jgi:hypothetical protein
VRSGAGIAHVLRHAWPLLLPRRGVVSLALWSHKALRLVAPWPAPYSCRTLRSLNGC